MKYLFISHEYPPLGGGGGNACMHLAEELAARGHTVHVLTVLYDESNDNCAENPDRISFFHVPSKRRSVSQSSFTEMLDFIHKARPRAEKLCKSEKYDYCLCFFGIPAGVLALHLKKKYGLRYVIRFGGGDIPGFQDRFRLLYRVLSPKLRHIWKNADGLVANSTGLKELALEFCSDYRIDVISNGVDTEEFMPEGNTESISFEWDRSISMLTVCRLIERKGLQDIIPYVHELENKTCKKIHWTIVGDGPYRGELMNLAVKYGTDDAISFEGHKQKSELPVYYKGADLFVFPSYKEGMPNVVLEAMASGLPVIMSEGCQGAEELVRDNGIACEGDFISDLEAMITMDYDRIRSMGENSRRLARDEFSWVQIAEKYEKLFVELS